MLDSLFGAEMPLAVKFVLAFIIVLGLIFGALWAVRRFGAGGADGMRGRQHRLSVLEWARVDNRRSLCLIRRDNVEHLLMIGGPSDVVVEANIVRAAAAPRDVGVARPAALETLPRAIPLPDNGNGAWPLQPEAATPPPPPRAAPKIEPASEDAPSWPLQPQADGPPPPRPQRDTLAALADELSARPTPPPVRSRPSSPPRPPLEPRGEPRAEPRAEPRMPAPQPASAAADAAAADQSLAEMAHRLEAALRKPSPASAEPRPPATPPRTAPPAEQAAAEPAAPLPPPQPRPPRPQAERLQAERPQAERPPADPKSQRNAPAKPSQGTTLYDNLEQEMASLLGRPTNKS